MPELIPFVWLALILGFKHSYDADHLIAVANFLRKAQTVTSAVRISASWALGHMMTAAIVTVLLYAFRESVLKSFLGNFEKVAGIMLIALDAGEDGLVELIMLQGGAIIFEEVAAAHFLGADRILIDKHLA